MSYVSPINLIQEQLETKIENYIVETVWKTGVDVDKQELIKALSYDRNQYKKRLQRCFRRFKARKNKII